MKKIFTFSLAAAWLVWAATTTAQDANNPWRMVAFEGDKEVAFCQTEAITATEATTQPITIALQHVSKFAHSIRQQHAGFDSHKIDKHPTTEITPDRAITLI